MRTDLVLRFGGGIEALLAAGRDALAAAETWHLESARALGVRSNIATGLLRAGRIDDAAGFVDDITDRYSYTDAWAPHAVRAALDTARGRPDEAMRRLKELENAVPAVLEDREATAVVTACELWLDRPDLAFRHLSRVLEVEVGSYDQISTGECQVLLVRAAADLAASGVERRSDLGRQVHQLLRGADPTETPGEAQRAHRAARAAELSRLAARPRPDLWVAAVKEWDTIGRLFEASYARWRGAQAALATGHGTLANRLLQRAAKEARDHIPLAQAIRETQQGLQRVKEGSALSS